MRKAMMKLILWVAVV